MYIFELSRFPPWGDSHDCENHALANSCDGVKWASSLTWSDRIMPTECGILPEVDSAKRVVNCRKYCQTTGKLPQILPWATYKSTYKSSYIQPRPQDTICSAMKAITLRRFFVWQNGIADSNLSQTEAASGCNQRRWRGASRRLIRCVVSTL